MLRIFFTALSIIFLFTGSYCQNPLIDSLKNNLRDVESDKKLGVIEKIYTEYQKSEPDSALRYAYKYLQMANEVEDSAEIGRALNFIGSHYQVRGEYDTCKYFYNNALDIYESIKNNKGKAMTLSNLGVLHRKAGNFDQALDYQLQSLNIREQLNDDAGMANNMHNIGGIYYYMNNYQKAVEYFSNARSLNIRIENNLQVAKTDNNMGSVFMEMGLIDSSLHHYQLALEYFEKHGYEIYAAIIRDNIGTIYGKTGNYSEALKYHQSTLSIHKKNNNLERLAHTFNNIGVLFMKMEEDKQAEKHLIQGLELAKKIDNKELIYELLHSLYENAEKTGRFKVALDYFIQHTAMKDTIMSEKTHQQMVEMETKYETEKKEQQIELQKSQLSIQEAELKQHQTQKYLFATTSFSILLITIILAIRYIEKRRLNNILAAKNRSITESISYAQKIQSAVLPPVDMINHMLPEHFILYLPRDIVSGDFYWITRAKGQTIVAAADCTGHGVPGAFMSMLGFTLLNEVVSGMELLQANIILNELRNKVKSSLRQTGDDYETQDGIDIALCVIDQQNQTMQYAGANNPLIIISEEGLHRIKPDRMPVGIQINEKASFTNHSVRLKKDDIIYLFSDGYIDQFGGETGTRLKASKFEELLTSISHLDMQSQHKKLKNFHLEWKNGYDQIDDILVMGIRV